MATRTKKEPEDEPPEERKTTARGSSTPARRTESKPGPKPTEPKPEPKADKPAPRARGPRKEPTSTGNAPEGEARRGALAALEAGLEEIVPGIEVLDRDLEFDEGGRADLAAMDPRGRIYLVLVADGGDERVVLDALDAHSFAQRNGDLLARHLGRASAGATTLPARGRHGAELLVICLENDEKLLARLRPLASRSLRLFGVRTMRSAAGERAYLMPLEDEPASGHGAHGPGLGASGGWRDDDLGVFLHALSEDGRKLARRLVERMSRLDESLTPIVDPEGVAWILGDEELMRMGRRGGELAASLAPGHRARSVSTEEDVEELLEGALARLVKLWAPEEQREPRGPREGGAGGPEWGEHLEGGGAAGDEDELEDGPPPGPDDTPILTPEEIQAFHG